MSDAAKEAREIAERIMSGAAVPVEPVYAYRVERLEHAIALIEPLIRRADDLLDQLNQVQSKAWMGADRLERERDDAVERWREAAAMCKQLEGERDEANRQCAWLQRKLREADTLIDDLDDSLQEKP